MSLRTRLILAFFLLSVVPLSAVTLFWYVSSVQAFERAARRESMQAATDMGRRMEFIATDVGRKMDRLFEVAGMPEGEGPEPDAVRARIAPMLGETAALVERVEFHPMPPPPGAAHPESLPHRPPFPPPSAREPGGRGGAPQPPIPPKPVVVDVPALIAEAKRAARAGAGSAGLDIGPLVDGALDASLPAIEAGIAAAAEAVAREAGKSAAAAEKLQLQLSGREIEIAVKKDGRVVGKANAVMNLERTLHTVLAFARRDQGEIPFAIDRQGAVYTPDPIHRSQLASLGIANAANVAAEGSPYRVGDWMLVARRDAGGFVFGIARPIGDSLREIRRMSWRNLSVGLAMIALACIGIVPISHRMTQHVSSLSAGVRQLAGGDFSARVAVRSSDEFGALATAFNRMAADLERHQTLLVEQERLRRELELSRQIQTEMLPRTPLRLGAAEIKGVSIPAREVGGDFFNYFALPDGRLALLVGDVSGKGVGAALLMANVQATLRARMPLETDLARLADALDAEIDANTPRGVYLTLFLGILDVDRGMLRYVNAGHNPQFLLRARGGILPLSTTGMPIALYPGHGYAESEVAIEAGDLLFFYTDGLVEAENETGEMFGADRLQALLADEHEQHIDTVLERAEGAIRTFRGRAEPFDDATLMALRINR
ncbi:MAG TPA: SpoIIE family protein phosphatase [Vicinamibacterales bacterium]|nr:SpoIIE family protein phosphatase [Vicinamibacterales bacterium]